MSNIDKEWINSELNTSEEGFIHCSPNEEQWFYKKVADGDIEAVKKNCEEEDFAEGEGIGRLSRDRLTNKKYHFVVSTALITRICSEAGMEMEQAYRLSDFYIQKLDDIHSLEEMDRLHDAMALDFTKRMNTLKRSASYSRPMTDCLNYIYAHVRDRVTIKDLAEYTSNSTSYISRLFKEELGISASDYIRQTKVERAKNMLKYSEYSLVEISNYLSFSSQSHFIQIFQKETGMSPRKYREAYAGSIWKEEAATDS
jgi:YesN/AraC family two-component response regulator